MNLATAGGLVLGLVVWYLYRLAKSFEDKSTGPRSTGLSRQ